MTNKEIVYRFQDHLETLYEACGSIQYAGGCDKCPLKTNCLDDTSVSEFANFTTKRALKEFLDFADDIENYNNEQDMDNYHIWIDAQKEVEKWQD